MRARTSRALFLASTLAAAAFCTSAQQNLPPVFVRQSGAATEGSKSRSLILEQQFREKRDWTFYHATRDLPDDIRAVLFAVAGRAVVGPGENFNTSDEMIYPGSTQHLFTAASRDLAVVAWYSGGLIALRGRVLLYDRGAGDALRYDLESRALAAITIDVLPEYARRNSVHSEYLPPEALRQ